MPRQIGWFIVLAIAVVVAALAFAAGREFETVYPEADEQTSVDTATVKHLSDHHDVPADFQSAEVRAWAREALLGSQTAATKLFTAYENCLTQHDAQVQVEKLPSASECEKAARFWVEVAAENGSVEAASIKHNQLADTGDCADTYRAGFWLRKIPGHDREEPWISAHKRLSEREKECAW